MRVVASMATMPGREKSLQLAIASLAPQVGALVVHFNGCTPAQVRDAMRNTPQNCFAKGSPENKGDQMKFLCAEGRGADWRLTCDDDLIYPHDYAETMMRWGSKLRSPVSAHGSKLRRPFNDYYRDRDTLHFVRKVSEPVEVDVLGTGTLCWFNGWHQFTEDDFPEPNMADIWAAVRFQQWGFPLHVIPHAESWIVDGNPGNTESIWHASQRQDGSFLDTGNAQTRVIESYAGLFNIE